MIAPAILSALHVLALALGLGAVFARGRRLRDLRRLPTDAGALGRLFQADGAWGAAALLWLATGLVRAFGGLEKSPDFYIHNGFFWVKMALFASVFALEMLPMTTFMRWRGARSRGSAPAVGAHLSLLITVNDVELAIVIVIPFVAALMARGAWLF
jgi:putative membrane protein